jgi:hypothetical protein
MALRPVQDKGLDARKSSGQFVPCGRRSSLDKTRLRGFAAQQAATQADDAGTV